MNIRIIDESKTLLRLRTSHNLSIGTISFVSNVSIEAQLSFSFDHFSYFLSFLFHLRTNLLSVITL